jgi:hypothetical protein
VGRGLREQSAARDPAVKSATFAGGRRVCGIAGMLRGLAGRACMGATNPDGEFCRNRMSRWRYCDSRESERIGRCPADIASRRVIGVPDEET